MKIAIVGTGYVGLVTGTCFAEMGSEVVCIDIDAAKLEKLRRGISPIYEPGLDDLLAKNTAAGRLTFASSLSEVIDQAEVIFFAVGTPPTENGSADIKYVLAAAAEAGARMNSYKLLVTKSTVPVGTSDKVREVVLAEQRKRGVEIPFDVASNPEFLKEGNAINDFMSPDRVIIGVESERAKETLTRLYRPFLLNNMRVIFMDIRSAEMTKYAANAMLATRISFMNDVANLCELIGADVNMVRRGIGSDTRIGNKFLYPGTGYGGSCFPKDIKALIRTAREYGYDMKVLEAVEEVNERQKSILFRKLSDYFGGKLSGRRVALWGLAFKPETDDVREAPSITVARLLVEAGAVVSAYDPAATEEFKRVAPAGINYAADKYEALAGADALLVMTEWKEFRLPSWKTVKEQMANLAIFDGRNIYERRELENEGIAYFNIGG